MDPLIISMGNWKIFSHSFQNNADLFIIKI